MFSNVYIQSVALLNVAFPSYSKMEQPIGKGEYEEGGGKG
jgi:hypothetical protein